ncbi:zinc-dependent peptidase [Lacinutrix sp. Bg11-31]|uniref:M90 family metallopeptidase n=1 Tax=Lacinutrix sp. Bg11-31 TaxID=2057808 RepID=UPI000C31A346|nr:M90 family metallopeptidase [Lacinutrix sp. Bg11-31]AUC81760.1 peptidase [Lacinutrix sp. Bg11-31]
MIYILIFIAFVIFVGYAFSKAKSKKVEKTPKHWHDILVKRVLFYKKLSPVNQAVFRKRMMLFLSQINIDGVNTEIEEIDKILIASSGIIPVFGFSNWSYNNLSGIIVYPDSFNEDLQFSDKDENKRILGMVGTGRFEKQMILSKKAIRLAFNNKTDKHNTPVHEFVHLLDKMDGQTDGVPELLFGKEYIAPWLELMHKEMEAINNDTSDIRKYGGTSEAEFFSVASEYFFERPKLFKQKHPELYAMLLQCFQQPKNRV